MLPALSTGELEIATGGVAASLFNGIARGLPIIAVIGTLVNILLREIQARAIPWQSE